MKKVGSIGPNICQIAFIGQSLGKDEEATGIPFIGGAGDHLTRSMTQNGIQRKHCYITNLCKYRPGSWWLEVGKQKGYKAPKRNAKGEYDKNDFSIFWSKNEPTEALKKFRSELLEELEGVETNLFVPLGADAMWALTGETTIGKYRGSILSTTLPSGRVVKVIPTFHPSFIISKSWNSNPLFQMDLKRILEDSKFSALRLPKRNLMVAPLFTQAMSFIEELHLHQQISFDIEASKTSVTCIALSAHGSRSMCIPTTTSFWGSNQSLKRILEGIHRLLSGNRVKIAQNIAFDLTGLFRFFRILPKGPWFDTMIAWHACYLELPKSLALLCSLLTREPYYKDDLVEYHEGKSSIESFWEYCARDAAVLHEIKDAIEKEMDELNVRSTYDYMMERLEPHLYAQFRGLNFDCEKMLWHNDDWQQELDASEKLFEATFGGVNPYSPKQLMKLFYDELKLPVQKKRGKPTTDEKAIEKLAKISPEARWANDCKKKRKMISTYLTDKTDLDGRLKCSYNSTYNVSKKRIEYGTTTGRNTSSEDFFAGGMNLQNWPKPVRDCVIPDKGMMFSSYDLKGAEAMLVAYLSNDEYLIKLFEGGVTVSGHFFDNIHVFTAYLIWGMSPYDIYIDKAKLEDEGKKTETKYFKGKKTRHGGNYLMGAETLAGELRCPVPEAEAALQRFYDTSINLTWWHKQIEERLKATRTLITPLGRKRIFFDRLYNKGKYGYVFNHDLLKKAVAFVPQETCSHILDIGCVRLYNTICKEHKDVEIMIPSEHDGLLMQHPPSKADLVHEAMMKESRVDLTINGRNFFIPIEIESGYNWRDLEEVK